MKGVAGMKRKIICAALAAVLALGATGAWAEGIDGPEGEDVSLSTTSVETGEPVAPTVVELPFTDVSGEDWFFDHVLICYHDGIMVGTEPTRFSPNAILPEEQAATLAARLRTRQRRDSLPEPYEGEAWYGPVLRYLDDLKLNITPGVQCTRARFLAMLGAVLEDDALAPICQVNSLPDTDDPGILRFYRAGILNGMDAYGTFQASGTLKRIEAAIMVSRILRPELRNTVTPLDYSPFRVLGVSPSTTFFTNGVTAERFLGKINALITLLEDLCAQSGVEFNWYNTYPEGGQTFLDYVTETALTELGVTRSMGTQYYALFDVQVYYSRLIDWRGGVPLGSGQVGQSTR